LTAKEAAQRCRSYLAELLGGVADVRLEEVELGEERTYWYVTLSYQRQDSFPMIGRDYKVFKVDARSGDVLSMKIREV
jgi:hypothetical protein